MIDRLCSLIKMKVPERNRGLLFASGSIVPVDETDGYQTGCLFQHTDGGDDTALYVNEGTVTSCDFNLVSCAAAGEMAQIEFDDDLTGPLISISTTDPTGDSYTTPFLITGTYSSTCALALQLSATNTRPVSFLFDDGGEDIAGGNLRGVLSRVLLCTSQTNGISLNALRGQVKMLNTVAIDSENAVIAPVTGYLELAGVGGRVLNGHVACVRAALEEETGDTTIGLYMSGFEATLKSYRVYDGDGWLAAYTVNVDGDGGESKWQYGLHMRGDSVSAGVLIGAQGEGVSLTTAFPFAVEVHSQADADIVAGDTGSSAGIYARNSIEFNQTSSTAHIGIFGKLRVKKDLAGGNHAGLMGWVEISGTTEIGGIASTQTAAGSFSVVAESGLNLSTGHLDGINIDCSVDDEATIGGTLTGIRIKSSAGCYPWTTGIQIEADAAYIGIRIGEFAVAAATTSAVPFCTEQDVYTDGQLSTMEIHGASDANLTGAYAAKCLRACHIVNCTTAAHETYGAMGQVVVKDTTLSHLHAGVIGTFEGHTSGAIIDGGYAYPAAAVMARCGGGAAITATKDLAGFAAFWNGAALDSGNSVAYAVGHLTTEWTHAIGVESCTNLFDLPASGTNPVEAGNYAVGGGTQVRISVMVGDVQYYMLASTAPTTES